MKNVMPPFILLMMALSLSSCTGTVKNGANETKPADTSAASQPSQLADSDQQGDQMLKSKKYADARALFLKAVENADPAGPHFEKEIESLCQSYRLDPQPPDAMAAAAEAVAGAQKKYGDEGKELVPLLDWQAAMANHLHKYKVGREASLQAIKVAEKGYGDSSIQLVVPIGLYIAASCADGYCPNLEPEWTRMLAIKKKCIGPEDPDTQMTAFQLCEVLEKKSHYDRCESLLQEILAVRRKQNSFLVTQTLASLSRVEAKQGHYDKAQDYLQQAIAFEKDYKGMHYNMMPYLEKRQQALNEEIAAAKKKTNLHKTAR
jgi:tetratricopeptide (TPR) repeat protein